jgi:hypothetical protein
LAEVAMKNCAVVRKSVWIFGDPQRYSKFRPDFWRSIKIFEIPSGFLEIHKDIRNSVRISGDPQRYSKFRLDFRRSTKIFEIPSGFPEIHKDI